MQTEHSEGKLDTIPTPELRRTPMLLLKVKEEKSS